MKRHLIFLSTLAVIGSQVSLGQGDQKQLITYSFPNLTADRTAYLTCHKVVVAHPDYTLNFSGRSKGRGPIENAVMQVLLNRKISTDSMSERNRTSDATYTLFLGRTTGFYGSVKSNTFCLFNKKTDK